MTHSPENKESNILTRMGRTVLWVLLPVDALRVIGKTARNKANARMKDARKHLPGLSGTAGDETTAPDNQTTEGWAQAVAASGKTPAQLEQGYRRQQLVFRFIFWISALSTGYWTTRTLDTPSGLFFSNIFLMLGCAMCGLSQSLIAGFRLWQIRNRRVSPAEKGTFRHFLAESNWFSEATGIGKGKH